MTLDACIERYQSDATMFGAKYCLQDCAAKGSSRATYCKANSVFIDQTQGSASCRGSGCLRMCRGTRVRNAWYLPISTGQLNLSEVGTWCPDLIRLRYTQFRQSGVQGV